MSIDYMVIPTAPVIPPSILANADELARRAARLSGLLAPETAACLARLLGIVDAHLMQNGVVTNRDRFNEKDTIDHRHVIIAVLRHHFRFLTEQPHRPDAAREITRHKFELLGLHPHLWSFARATRCLDKLVSNEAVAGQPNAQDHVRLIGLMLQACIDEVDFILDAFNRKTLRERVQHSFESNQRIVNGGISPGTAPAVLNLLIQGSQPSSEFLTFTGLSTR